MLVNKEFYSENILAKYKEILLFYQNFDIYKNDKNLMLDQMWKNQILSNQLKEIIFEETQFNEELFRKTIIK